MSYNRLTTIPEGFLGDLDDLRRVSLRGNELLVLPPGLFAGVDDLETVWLDENPGAPFPFYLELIRTDNTDPMAPAPATVEVRVAEGAPFEVEIGLVSRGGSLDDSEVAISAGDTASRSVTASAVASAAHSLAIDSIWDNRSWFEEDDYLGLEFAIGAPLVLANPDEVKVEVPAVYLTQGAQSLDGSVPLVAGRQALLRVFATADADNDFDPRARATFYVGDATVYVDLTPPAVIPRAVDESRMDGSFTGVVPAMAMQPGVEMVVELDRTDVIPETDGSQLRIPATGRMALDVVALETFDLKIVPIAFGSDVTGRNDKVASLAEDLAGDDSRGALPPTRTLLPIAEMDVTARDRYVTWADTLEDGIVALPDELRLLRHAEAGGTDTYYHGIFAVPATHYPDYWDVILGVAYIAAWSGLSLSHDVEIPPGLPRYLCSRTGPQPGSPACALRWPLGCRPTVSLFQREYRGLGLRIRGWRGPWASAESGRVPGPHVLLRAGGCQRLQLHAGIGLPGCDCGLGIAPAAGRAAPKTLLLWGSIRDGRLRLEPVFQWAAPVKLPESPGPYRLAGADGTGQRLFELSFSPDETGDGDMGFLFAIETEETSPRSGRALTEPPRRPRLLRVVVDDAPQPRVVLAHDPRHRSDRHLPGQIHDELLEGERQLPVRPRPRQLRLPDPARRAVHPWRRRLKDGAVSKEVQMPPPLLGGVVGLAAVVAATPAGEGPATSEVQVHHDLALLVVEQRPLHEPRQLQTQRLVE